MSAAPKIIRDCAVCQGPVKPRPGERMDNFKRRLTCSEECRQALIARYSPTGVVDRADWMKQLQPWPAGVWFE